MDEVGSILPATCPQNVEYVHALHLKEKEQANTSCQTILSISLVSYPDKMQYIISTSILLIITASFLFTHPTLVRLLLLMPVEIHLNIQYPVHTPVEVADVMLHISALLLSMVPPPRSRSMGRICNCRELAHSTQGPISQVNKLCYSGTHGVAVPESMCLTAPLIGSRGSELAANDGAYLFADPCRLPALVQPPPERSEKMLDGLPATQRTGLPSWPTSEEQDVMARESLPGLARLFGQRVKVTRDRATKRPEYCWLVLICRLAY